MLLNPWTSLSSRLPVSHSELALRTFFFVLLVLLYRIHFGIDFTDESFYVGMPLRFAEGAVPFRDEYYIQQTAAFALVPFTKMFLSYYGREGIVLFFRYLYVLMACSVSWATLTAFKPAIGNWRSLLLATIPLSAVLYSIPSMSYNTVGCLGFTLGLLLMFGARHTERPTIRFCLGGMAFAFCLLAYPTLAPACLLGFLALIRFQSARRRDCFYWAVMGATLMILPIALWTLTQIKLAEVFTTIDYTARGLNHTFGWNKVMSVSAQINAWAPWPLWLAMLVVSSLCFYLQRRPTEKMIVKLAGLVLSSAIIFLMFGTRAEPFFYFSCIGGSAVFFGALLGNLTQDKAIFQGLLLPLPHRWVSYLLGPVAESMDFKWEFFLV